MPSDSPQESVTYRQCHAYHKQCSIFSLRRNVPRRKSSHQVYNENKSNIAKWESRHLPVLVKADRPQEEEPRPLPMNLYHQLEDATKLAKQKEKGQEFKHGAYFCQLSGKGELKNRFWWGGDIQKYSQRNRKTMQYTMDFKGSNLGRKKETKRIHYVQSLGLITMKKMATSFTNIDRM